MTRQELGRAFKEAGYALLGTTVGVATHLIRNAFGYTVVAGAVIYGYDAAHGHYCMPEPENRVGRFFATAGNDVVNIALGGLHIADIKTGASCPSQRYFAAPERKPAP